MRSTATAAAVLGLAAALTLAGCGSAAAPAAHTAATAAAATPGPSCRQQYETWKHGPARAAFGRFKTTFRAVVAQANAEDFPGLGRALQSAGRAAAAMAAVPVPRCADPKGYYGLLFARVKAAGDNARSASGLGGLILAEAPLKTVPGIESKLGAELNQTVGKNR